MKSASYVAALGLLVTMCQASTTSAQPTSHTKYSYFPVQGSSLPELHSNMVRHGPTANGVRGYGTTAATMGKKMGINACKANGGYHFDVEFLIKLPKATNPAALSPAERGMWNRFAQFVKKHEETHRTIWMGCAAEFDRMLQASGSQDCPSRQARAMTLWNEMLASCSPKQVAFDQAQQGVLRQSPFIKQAAR
jgi:predicted secreted Zn-dependent protease